MRSFPVLLLSLPSTALACAACARDQGQYAWLVVGAFLATPYLVVSAALWALRRAGVRP